MARRRGFYPKASQVYAPASILIAQAFPEIGEVKVEVIEQGHSEACCDGRPCYYSSSTNPYLEYADCHHSECYGGGFSVGDILSEMVISRETERETGTGCLNWPPCIHFFKVRVHIDYREPASAANEIRPS